MKIRLILLAMMLFATALVHAEQFPINFTIDSLNAAAKNTGKWHGKMIALGGRVDSMTTSYANKPYFHVVLGNPNPERKGIWIGWITNLDQRKVSIGNIVLVLGYFVEIDKTDSLSSKLSHQPYHMLAICMANVTTQEGAFGAEVQKHWDLWMKGTIPAAEPIPIDTTANKSGPGMRLRLNK